MLDWLNALPGAVAQGMIWGIMAIGVYITYKILDIADLTVDGSMCTGAAVCTMLMLSGVNVWLALLISILAGMLAGFVTGAFHTFLGIPAILAGILTQLICGRSILSSWENPINLCRHAVSMCLLLS